LIPENDHPSWASEARGHAGYTCDVPMLFSIEGEGVKQFIELGAAFLLSAAIGLEREVRHKSAGLRTYTVVGTAAALFMLVSKYGFMNVLAA
jgi:putative Mg2+ transporter-C (MgtC) family protein